MFHTLVQKPKALCALIFDSKIIFISCTYVPFTMVLIPILRNTLNIPNLFGISAFFILGIGLLIVINRLRNITAISDMPSKKKKVCSKLLHFLNGSILLVIIPVICMIRLAPLISLERQLEAQALSFTNKYTQFQSVISSELDIKHTYNRIEIKPLGDVSVEGDIFTMEHQKVLIKVKKYQEFKIGQVCNISGVFKRPENFEDFNYQEYLKNNNIYLLMEYPEITCPDDRKGFFIQNVLIDFKEKLTEKIQWRLNEPQSSLLMGIMFGQDRLFSDGFERNIRIAGVSHIVAASGYNITILILASSKLLSFLPYKIRFPINMVLIWGFCILSGLSPSILRACIMTTIVLCGTLLGRKNTIHVTLPLATLIFVLVEPRIVFDVGFQLSVMATFGLIYLQPSLASILKRITKREIGFVNDTLLTTLSCTLTTLPITIMTFNTLSIWSILANCMILPVIESTMLLGVLALVSGSIVFYEIINVQLMYFELVVNWIGSLNFGYWEFETVSSWIPIAIMAAIIFFCIYLYPVKNENSNYYFKICS